MRITLMVEGQEGVTWPEWVALAAAAEECGLDGLFRSDHLTAVYRPEAASLDAWATLAALAAVTSRIRLGTLVTPATFRHPSVLARLVTTVDHVSGGRVELGMGAGWYEREHTVAGIPFPEPRARFDLLAEQLEVIVRSWTEDAFDHAGAAYTLAAQTALPRPVQAPHPPLILGGTARRRGAGLAARWASEYNSLGASLPELLERRARLDAACAEVARDPETLPLSLMTTCVIGRDSAEIDERLQAARAIAGPEWDEQVGNWFVGTPERVGERVVSLRAARVERVFLKVLDHRDLDAVRLLGSVAGELG